MSSAPDPGAAKRARQERADSGQHLDARLAVGQVVLEAWENRQLALLAGAAQRLVHAPAVDDGDGEVAVAVEQEDWRGDRVPMAQRRALDDVRAAADEFGDVAGIGVIAE